MTLRCDIQELTSTLIGKRILFYAIFLTSRVCGSLHTEQKSLQILNEFQLPIHFIPLLVCPDIVCSALELRRLPSLSTWSIEGTSSLLLLKHNILSVSTAGSVKKMYVWIV